MLNDFLYRTLKVAFGSVEVENEGVQADIERDYSSGYTTTWRLSDNGEHGEQYRINCPFCRNRQGQRDTKHHLYISYLSYSRPRYDGVELAVGPLFAHCFRCDSMSDPEKRRQLEIMIHAGMSAVGDGMATSVAIDMQSGSSAEPLYSTSDQVTLDGIRTWVPDFHWCEDGMDPDIEEYLAGRGVTLDMMHRFGLGWGEVRTPRTGQALNNGVPWVVVPVVMNGRLRGVQARCPDKFLSEGGIRYWIHPGMRKRTVVYNLDAARSLGLAVVCEGVFDVFKVGAPGVCCFGHIPSQLQQTMLCSMSQGLIWLPDNEDRQDLDTVSEAESNVKGWNAEQRFPKGAHVVKLPAKDAGEMSRQDIWVTILSQVPDKMAGYIVDKVLSKV